MENENTVEPLEEVEEEITNIQAPKKPRTQKQMDALNKMRQTREENVKKRAVEKSKIKEEEKIVLEEKIMKKAVSIKKKKIKQELILDDISDDDEPIEQIKQKIVKCQKVIDPIPIIKRDFAYQKSARGGFDDTEPERPSRPTIYFV